MKEIIKIGVSVVGVILLIQSFNDIQNFITTILDYLDGTHKSSLSLGFSLFIVLLKIISGLILTIRPTIVSNVYVPQKVDSLDNTPYKLVITFIFCFGIYLIITASINTINLIISQFQFVDGLKSRSSYFKYWWLDFVKYGVQIAVGYSLYKRFLEEIYSRD